MAEAKKCDETIEYLVPWGGKLLKLCRYHTVGFVKMAHAMGSPIEVAINPSTQPCPQPDRWTKDEKAGIDAQLEQVLGVKNA